MGVAGGGADWEVAAMANEEQLALLRQGIAGWNEWRRRNPDAKIDLSCASIYRVDLKDADVVRDDLTYAERRRVYLTDEDLSRAELGETHINGPILSREDLLKTNFREADFRGADLRGAGLRRARLLSANLRGADLRGADLRWTILLDADLRAANLNWADLRGALLFMASFDGANLFEANLGNATLGATMLGDVDLSSTKGLESVEHEAPSRIGIDTIYKSKGKIPEVFLRGCGVPEDMIEFLRSIRGKAIEFYSCFISYSSKDEDFAKRLHADLQRRGIRVWFAPEDLKIGDSFELRINEAIRIYDKLMLVLSENSIESAWVEREVRTGLQKEEELRKMVLFPIRLDDAVMQTTQQWAHDIRRQRHIGDFRQWKDHDLYQRAFERLVRDMRAGEGGEQ
jgi:uncharacterized protein YjbI with pentapeptide repeats